ncbi:MAG: recombinase family protein [Spirochaetales bacterium]|nr:recombinase family protein [Spirochaetales bacterium]
MNQIVTTGMICLDDPLGFTYRISAIEFILREDESFSYVFTPNYSVIDLLTGELFQGIPGLDMDLRKPRYVRENMTPVFISERTPAENREDLWELLADAKMDYLNRLEWLIRTNTRYSGDNLYVVRWNPDEAKQCVNYTRIEQAQPRSAATIQQLLRIICAGDDVSAEDFSINDSNRREYYSLLMSLYRKEKSYIEKKRVLGIRESAAQGKYRGRTPVQIDDTKLIEVVSKYRSGKITAQEACTALGVSRSTFFRKISERAIPSSRNKEGSRG